MTLDEIVRRNALRYAAKPALVMDDRSHSWRELDRRVSRLASAISDHRVCRGDRVAVLLSNCPEYFEIYFACARAGVIAVPLNYRLGPRELLPILEHAEPALFIAGAEYAATLRELASLWPRCPQPWLVGEGELDGTVPYEDGIRAGRTDVLPAHGDEREPVAIFYTSGTTGPPKGAMVSHLNLEMNGYNQILADQSLAEDINLVATPVYHVGAVFMAITYMMLGCTQVLLPRFEPDAWMRAMQSSRASVSLLIPTMINAVLNHPAFGRYDLSALRLIFYGGGPMPPVVLERAMRKLGCAFTQGYGLTETLEATFLVAADHILNGSAKQQKRLHSAGREAAGASVRIVNDAGIELDPGEVGEILVRSRSVISGYWKMPEETAMAIRGGWFYTGDLGYLDEDRYLFVVDRKKDMVVSGGVNIYTKEIEVVLYEHPAVLEAAVIGLPDEEWGEMVTAAVVRKPGMAVSAGELMEHCRGRLAGFKKPRTVIFLDELPKNPSGKILKRELRASLAAT